MRSASKKKKIESILSKSKIRYYTCRDRVTVCLIKSSQGISRGISVCSLEDESCTEGKVKAKGRAVKALYRKQSYFPIRKDAALKALDEAGVKMFFAGAFKSHYNPTLLPNEEALFKSRN